MDIQKDSATDADIQRLCLYINSLALHTITRVDEYRILRDRLYIIVHSLSEPRLWPIEQFVDVKAVAAKSRRFAWLVPQVPKDLWRIILTYSEAVFPTFDSLKKATFLANRAGKRYIYDQMQEYV